VAPIRTASIVPRVLILCTCILSSCNSLVIPLPAADPASSLKGISLPRLHDGASIDLGEALTSSCPTDNGKKTMLILGTHPGDFNMIEYIQRLQYSLPKLQSKGVDRYMVVMNGEASACAKLAELLDLPTRRTDTDTDTDDEDTVLIEIFPDPTGEAGRRFGVDRGWRPDDTNLPPLLKLTVVGLGFGPPWGTLPAVLPGYTGNPSGKRGWIEASLEQGQRAGRWPEVLRLAGVNGDAADGGASGSGIVGNKFDDFPLLGGWGIRPLELATLRLQNIIGIQMQHWDELGPVDDRCLSQLGGCTIVGYGGKAVYSWVDRGLCDVPDMDDILDVL